MTPLRVIGFSGTFLLLAACSRAPEAVDAMEIGVNASTEPVLSPDPIDGQVWKPISGTGADGILRESYPEVGRGTDPWHAPLGTQPTRGYPEGAIRRREPPVPDHVLAAQLAAADANVRNDSPRPSHPNALQPGERSASTITQAVGAAKDDRDTRP